MCLSDNPLRKEKKVISVMFLLKIHNMNLHEKYQTTQIEGHTTNNWMVPLKIVKVMKNKD